MSDLLPFFVILLAGAVLSELFRRLHLPWVVALVLAGIVVGPHGLKILSLGPELKFIANIGLMFLMFMAGLQTRLSSLAARKKKIAILSLFNGIIPFFVGLAIGRYFGYDWLASLLLGSIFISSSIAVVVPALEATGILKKSLGKTIVATTIVKDVTSLVLLSILLQLVAPSSFLPLSVLYPVLLISLVLLRLLLPKLRQAFASSGKGDQQVFEEDLQVIFTMLVGTVLLFEVLGLHSIIASFFAGLVLSESIKSSRLKEKLHAIGYGLFIPVFFVVIGAQTDLGVFSRLSGSFLLTVMVLVGSIGSKFISGWLGALTQKFSSREAAIIGASSIPQLSTALAVAFAGVELGILNSSVVSVLVVLSFTTTFLGPYLLNRLLIKKD